MIQINRVRRPLDGRALREFELAIAAAAPRRWHQVGRVALLARLARRHGVIYAGYKAIARMWRASARTVRRWFDALVAAGLLARVAARGRGGGSVHVVMAGLDVPAGEVAARLRPELAVSEAPPASAPAPGSAAMAAVRAVARLGATARGLPGRLGVILQRAAVAKMGQLGTIDRNPESESARKAPSGPAPAPAPPAHEGFAALYAILRAAPG